MVAGRVKGTLFTDYVRMIRGHKQIDWAKHLRPGDLELVRQQILPTEWYPMEAFERLGNAILIEISRGDVGAARAWGRFSVDELCCVHPDLVADGDPAETMTRFQSLRASFFDYPAVQVVHLTRGEARVQVAYGMGAIAEEAATNQTLGFFERLLAIAGATVSLAAIMRGTWRGDPVTILELRW